MILGLNAYHADASAALVDDGRVRFAVEEERLNRRKHCAGFPALAARACLEAAGVTLGDLERVAISRDPGANLGRKAWAVLSGAAPASMLRARVANRAEVLRADEELARAVDGSEAIGQALAAPLTAVEHHRAHLASAFYCSPFEEAALLSLDGFGDFVSTMWARGRGNAIDVLGAVRFPHSLGVLYTAVSQWLGFTHYGDEGKVMGLAPYGEPRYVARLERAVSVHGDGFRLHPAYFTHTTSGLAMSWRDGEPRIGRLYTQRFVEELGPARAPEAPLTGYHEDIAASLQALTEKIIFHVARRLHALTRLPRLCLAGGVALNSVANGKLRAETPFREIYVQPAAGDGGTALGAALWVEHGELGRPRREVMQVPSLGPAFDAAACEAALGRARLPDGVRVTRAADEAALCEAAAALIAEGKIVGWFQGRMELGPRALGNRSLLADPRRAEMKELLNRRIKRREPFRPFAPSVLAEAAAEWFEDAQPSPAMLMVLPFRASQRARVPAVVHVDGSGRLQTVARDDAPLYHQLIAAFSARTGVPMVLNTSFNENEPIVCTPDEALACFTRTEMDALCLGPWVVTRGGLQPSGGSSDEEPGDRRRRS